MINYTDPATVDVDTVIAEIAHAFKTRRSSWTDRLSWSNVTVAALADEIKRLQADVELLETDLLESINTASDQNVEIERLRAIVSKLPVTADGVPVTSMWTMLWRWTAAKKPQLVRTNLYHRGNKASDCYSTRAAAALAESTEAVTETKDTPFNPNLNPNIIPIDTEDRRDWST